MPTLHWLLPLVIVLWLITAAFGRNVVLRHLDPTLHTRRFTNFLLGTFRALLLGAALALELGCHGVLMNTAIAHAKNPVLMAEAMKEGVRAGRMAFLAGRMGKSRYANASSPTAGLIE